MMKKTFGFWLLLTALCVVSCGGGSDEPGVENDPTVENGGNTENEEQQKPPAIDKVIEELCGGYAFAEYEMKEYQSSGRKYKAPSRRKEYKFTSDGKGTSMTYTFNNSDRGYAISNSEFTWRKDGDTGISIKEGSIGAFTLSNMAITETGVSFTGGEWEKELPKPVKIKKEELISYSVENLEVWMDTSSEPCAWITPAVLTLNTKNGVIRYFIGIVTRGADYYKGNDSLYMLTRTNNHCYTIYFQKDMDFEGKNDKYKTGDNWIKIAEVKDNKIVSCIENRKEYKLE